MLKICKDRWDRNKDKLEAILKIRTDLNSCDYKEIVKFTLDKIFNDDDKNTDKLDIEKIIEIDNGDYQGTLIYLIPFSTYQPSESEYLMTCVGYGSCSGCDTLQSIQDWDDKKLNDQQVKDFMSLCKDIITNLIKPYNNGWRKNDEYEIIHVEVITHSRDIELDIRNSGI